MRILVTGGAGFIGSCFVRGVLSGRLPLRAELCVNLDALTYAGDMSKLGVVVNDPRHVFMKGDIADRALCSSLMDKYEFDAVVHFAAESHVDRSVASSEPFFRTNVMGTLNLLECALARWSKGRPEGFRFLHVSTDEVYGSIGADDAPWTEECPFRPNSPYSASKAASDHAVRAFNRTHGLPTLTTNCSNNYGLFQNDEKFIPTVIGRCLKGEPIPIYGNGTNVRDWIHVDDHCRALCHLLTHGAVGESYNIGGGNERSNIWIVDRIVEIVDRLRPVPGGRSGLKSFVKDRPGHDFRYSVDCSKLKSIGWAPSIDFDAGLESVVGWCASRR